MATLSSILAWEIRGACQATILGVAEELEITEILNNNITVSQENQTKHNLLLFHRDEDQVSKIC